MIFREQELLFRGSRERLKRNIEKKGGTVFPERRFRLIWHSRYFRRGLSFQILGRYEQGEEGLLLTYRFRPTIVTLLWVSVPVALLLWFALWECGNGNWESAMAASLFSLLYPAVAVWQAFSCHKEFRRCFQVATK